MTSKNTQDLPVALITGAARRIGREIALALHEANYRVIIHCFQSKDEAQQLAHSLNEKKENSATVICGDLGDQLFLEDLIQKTIDWGQHLDVLVNNASLFEKTNFQKSKHFWQELFAINVEAPFKLSHLAFPYLQSVQGVIINITDIHAQKPLKDYSIYCQTKAALAMQTKSLALEFAPSVRVNSVAPGAILWPENDNILCSALKEKIIKETPLKQHGKPEYIAKAVLSLIENTFITGQTLLVDGGRLLS